MSKIRNKLIATLAIFAMLFTSMSAVMFAGSNFAKAEGEDSTEVQAVFSLQDGASAALLSKLNDEEDYVGLRWKTIINKAYYDSLNENGDLEFGTIIAPKSYGDLDFSQISKNSSGDWCITGTDKYVSVIPNDVIHNQMNTFDANGEYVMYSAIRYEEFEESGVSIKNAFATELVAKAYVKITDGENVTYEYSTADTVRSLRNSIVHDYIAGDYNEQPEVADKLKDFVGINEIKETSSGAKAYAFYNKGGNEEEFVELKGKEIIGAAINSTEVEATIDSETGIVTFGAINNYPGKNTAYLSVFTSDGDVYYKQINIAKGISTAEEFVETFSLAKGDLTSTSTLEDLATFDGYYILTNNIDFEGMEMPTDTYTFSYANHYNTYAAYNTAKTKGLTGTFDGNGYTIYNLKVPKGGLFGIINGNIKNVAFINIDLAQGATGGLFGALLTEKARFTNVYIDYSAGYKASTYAIANYSYYSVDNAFNKVYISANIALFVNIMYPPTSKPTAEENHYTVATFTNSDFIYISKQSVTIGYGTTRINDVKGNHTTDNKPLRYNKDATVGYGGYIMVGSSNALRFNSVNDEGDTYSLVSSYETYETIIDGYENDYFDVSSTGMISWGKDSDDENTEGGEVEVPKTEVDMTSTIITLDDDGEIIPFADGDIVSANSNTDGVTASIVNNKVVLEGATADNKTIYSLEVETEKTIYKISAKYVTVYIKTAEEFVETFNLVADAGVTSTNELAKLNTFSGYYLLANNIDFDGKVKPTEKFVFSSANHYMASGAYTTAKTKGLTGTFDGNGYTLYNLKAPQGGLFGIISGDLKNVAFINLDLADGATGGMLAAMILDKSSGVVSNIENVYIDYTGGYKANKYVLANLNKAQSTYILRAYISAEIPMFGNVVYGPTEKATLTQFAGNPYGTSVFIYVSKQSPVIGDATYRIFDVQGTFTTNNKPLWKNASTTPTATDNPYTMFGASHALRFNSVNAEGDAYSMVSKYQDYAGTIEGYNNACFNTDEKGRIYWKNDYRLYSDNKLLENNTIALDTESNNETGLSVKDALGNVVSDGITYSIVDNKDGAIKIEEGSATITALKLGSATIVVKKDGITYFTITVNVTKPVVDKTSIPVIIDADGESFSFEDGDIISVKTYADGVTASVVDNKVILEGATADNKTEYIIEVEEANHVYRLTAKYVTAYIKNAGEFKDIFGYTADVTTSTIPTRDGYYLLAGSIDFASETFSYGFNNTAFVANTGALGLTGTFDGNGYTISNLTAPKGGVFGIVNGTVKNVAFINVNVPDTNKTGILATYTGSTAVFENIYLTYNGAYSTNKALLTYYANIAKLTVKNSYFQGDTVWIGATATSTETTYNAITFSSDSSAMVVTTYALSRLGTNVDRLSDGNENGSTVDVKGLVSWQNNGKIIGRYTNIYRYGSVSEMTGLYQDTTDTTRNASLKSLLAKFDSTYFDFDTTNGLTWKVKAAEENQGGSQGGNEGGNQGGTEDDNQGETLEKVMVNLGIPSLGKYPNGEKGSTIAAIKYFNGKLYIGMGDFDNDVSSPAPIHIYAYDLSTGDWEDTGSVPDDSVLRFIEYDGTLYIPGTDPSEGWDLGNYYKLENGTWVKHRELPYVIHCFDMVEFDGKLMFAAGSDNFKSAVVYTADGGKTYGNIEFYNTDGTTLYGPTSGNSNYEGTRAYEFFKIGDELYVFHTKTVLKANSTTSTSTFSAIFKYVDGKFIYHKDTTNQGYNKTITTQNKFHAKAEYGDKYFFCNNYLYYTIDGFNNKVQVTMPNSANVTSFEIVGDNMIILAYVKNTNDYTVTLYNWKIDSTNSVSSSSKIYSFTSDVAPTVMEYHDGYAYIGTGNIYRGAPNNQKNGALLRIKVK